MSCRAPFLIVIMWLLAGMLPSYAQERESELKGAFIYNFVKFTQWQDRVDTNSTINVCASPESALYDALQRAENRPGRGREIVVVPLMNAGLGDCHVVVVTYEDNRKLAHIRRLLSSGPVLGVTDDPTALPGEMIIVMSMDRSRVVFSVNNTRAVSLGLSISSRLLRLARSVQ